MINVGTPNIALVNDAISIYENAFTTFFNSPRPLEAKHIRFRVLNRLPYRVLLVRTTANIYRVRNEVRHTAAKDIDYPRAKSYLNNVESALLQVNCQPEADRVADLRDQLDALNGAQTSGSAVGSRNILDWFSAQNLVTQIGISMFFLPLLVMFAAGLANFKIPDLTYNLLAWLVVSGILVGAAGFVVGGSDP